MRKKKVTNRGVQEGECHLYTLLKQFLERKRKKKGRKRKNQRKKEEGKEKEKERKRGKERPTARERGREREQLSKRERRTTVSHHGQPRAAVVTAAIGFTQ